MKRKQRFFGRRRAIIKLLGKAIASAALALGAIVPAYLGMVTFPQLMFSNHVTYQSYEVWSDRTIPPQINQVLDDATRRLYTSKPTIFTQTRYYFTSLYPLPLKPNP